MFQQFWYHSSSIQEPVKVGLDFRVDPVLDTDAAGEMAIYCFINHIIYTLTTADIIAASPDLSNGEIKHDAEQAALAVRTLASLLFTSSAFRLILSDVLITSREALADIVVDVSAMASFVQNRANQVEEFVRPPPGTGGLEGLDNFDAEIIKGKGKRISERVGDISDETAREARRRRSRTWNSLESNPDRVKEAFIERVKGVRLFYQTSVHLTYHSSLGDHSSSSQPRVQSCPVDFIQSPAKIC